MVKKSMHTDSIQTISRVEFGPYPDFQFGVLYRPRKMYSTVKPKLHLD